MKIVNHQDNCTLCLGNGSTFPIGIKLHAGGMRMKNSLQPSSKNGEAAKIQFLLKCKQPTLILLASEIVNAWNLNHHIGYMLQCL
jgi:hypothetical protein